jgi:hypothetical protein
MVIANERVEAASEAWQEAILDIIHEGRAEIAAACGLAMGKHGDFLRLGKF